MTLTFATKEEVQELLDFLYGKKETFDDVEKWRDLFDFDLKENKVNDQHESLKRTRIKINTEAEEKEESRGAEKGNASTHECEKEMRTDQEKSSVSNDKDDDENNSEKSSSDSKPKESEEERIVVEVEPPIHEILQTKDNKENSDPKPFLWSCIVPECSSTSLSFPSLVKHVIKTHRQMSMLFTCQNCGEKFMRREDFLLHHHASECEKENDLDR